MRNLYLEPKISKEQAQRSQGYFFGRDEFSSVVKGESTKVFVRNEKGNWELLVLLIKKPVVNRLSNTCIQQLKKHAYHASNNRGYAGGFIDPSKQSKNVERVENPNRIKSRLIFKDGRVSSYRVGNKVNSGIIGYSEAARLQQPNQPCRTTAFTLNHPEMWKEFQQIACDMALLYNFYLPKAFQLQRSQAKKSPKFMLEHTPFSTVTVNHNWRTACHVDKGDFQGGYTAIHAIGEGWKGYLLGYPRYDVAIEMEAGDVVFQNAHEEHCNTEGEGDRLSFIFYLREGMKYCQ